MPVQQVVDPAEKPETAEFGERKPVACTEVHLGDGIEPEHAAAEDAGVIERRQGAAGGYPVQVDEQIPPQPLGCQQRPLVVGNHEGLQDIPDPRHPLVRVGVGVGESQIQRCQRSEGGGELQASGQAPPTVAVAAESPEGVGEGADGAGEVELDVFLDAGVEPGHGGLHPVAEQGLIQARVKGDGSIGPQPWISVGRVAEAREIGPEALVEGRGSIAVPDMGTELGPGPGDKIGDRAVSGIGGWRSVEGESLIGRRFGRFQERDLKREPLDSEGGRKVQPPLQQSKLVLKVKGVAALSDVRQRIGGGLHGKRPVDEAFILELVARVDGVVGSQLQMGARVEGLHAPAIVGPCDSERLKAGASGAVVMGPIGAQVLIGETVSCPGCRLLVEHDRGGEEIGGLTRVGIIEGRNEAGRPEVELGQGRAGLVELDLVGSQRTCRDDSSGRQAGGTAWRPVELEEGVASVESCREVGGRRKV